VRSGSLKDRLAVHWRCSLGDSGMGNRVVGWKNMVATQII